MRGGARGQNSLPPPEGRRNISVWWKFHIPPQIIFERDPDGVRTFHRFNKGQQRDVLEPVGIADWVAKLE
eukprot:12335766-Prorocentrum_lima.AAC.1